MALRRGNKTGASAVEFAIILPILILILFGIIEFSILFYDKAVITNASRVTNASREGARSGIVYRYPARVTEEEIRQVVIDYCADYLINFANSPLLTISAPSDGLAAGDPLTVTVSYPYQFLILPNFVATLTGGINLVATTVMRME